MKFSKKVEEAANKHDAYTFPVLLRDFGVLDFPEETWELIAQGTSIQMWPFQSSWKSAVGAQCFLDAAIDRPHQNLLRNVLKPFLSWSFSAGGFDEVYAEVTSAVYKTIQTHPYLRRRSALYSLTAATRLQHPLARLFLTEAIRFYDNNHDRFFGQNHTLVKHGLKSQAGQEMLHRFIAAPDTEAFVDLRNERDLKDPAKLREMAALGLPHYNFLLGELMYAEAQPHFPYPPKIIDPVIGQYREAADQGDSDACLKVANLMNALSISRTNSSHPLNLSPQYSFLAAWHGNEKSFKYARIQRILNQENIPGTPADVFKAVKIFLIPKHR